jgi:hypothetical protein
MNARADRPLTADELHQISGGTDAVAHHEALHKAENSKTPPASVPVKLGSSLPWRITIRF